MIDAAEVLRVLGLLGRAGVEVWVDGGWGVDALLGEQTRPHGDLDLALRTEDRDAFLAAMAADGYLPAGQDGPFNVVVADRAGHEVDAHLVDLHATRVDERALHQRTTRNPARRPAGDAGQPSRRLRKGGRRVRGRRQLGRNAC